MPKVAEIHKAIIGKVGIFNGALLVCATFACIQYPLYILGLLHYNPFITITDISANLICSILLISLTGSPIASFSCILTLYLIGGIKFYYLRRNLTVGDLDDLNELLEIFPLYSAFIGCIFVLVCIWILIRIHRHEPKTKRSVGWLLFSSGLVAYASFFPTHIYELIRGRNIEQFNRGADFLWGGQLYAIGYDFVEKRSVKEQLVRYKSNPNFQPRYSFENIGDVRNIHIILLESYTSLERLGIRDAPMGFPAPYRTLDKVTYALAPVYGGNTPRANMK